ncbi:hypothetical protein TNCV_1860821 [Trichonephila clavipes]|nr:hypothetical protein TNCV_1860821 [Trichonephila clavipes]
MDADSDDENQMNNASPVPRSSKMRNVMKSIHSYLEAHSNSEMNNKMDDVQQFVDNLILKKQLKEKFHIIFQKLKIFFKKLEILKYGLHANWQQYIILPFPSSCPGLPPFTINTHLVIDHRRSNWFVPRKLGPREVLRRHMLDLNEAIHKACEHDYPARVPVYLPVLYKLAFR